MNTVFKISLTLLLCCICIIQGFAQETKATLLSSSELAGKITSDDLSLAQKVALLQIASKNDIRFDDESKAVVKKFLLKSMTS